HAAFWVDTPEEGLEIYRSMVAKGTWPHVRTRFLNAGFCERSLQRLKEGITRSDAAAAGAQADLASPCLTGWKWQDRKRASEVWGRFMDELARSKDPVTISEGLYLRCSYSWSEEEYERNLKVLLDYLWEQREKISQPALAADWLTDAR